MYTAGLGIRDLVEPLSTDVGEKMCVFITTPRETAENKKNARVFVNVRKNLESVF